MRSGRGTGPAPAQALTIDASFINDSTLSATAFAHVEQAFDNAAKTIEAPFSNPMTVNVLVAAVPGTYFPGTTGWLMASDSSFYWLPYTAYASLLAAAAKAHPENSVLNTAVADLSFGNKESGVIATNTVFEALGASSVYYDLGSTKQAYKPQGQYLGPDGKVYDGVIFVNADEPFTYTQPVSAYDSKTKNITYDATASFEHEIDEVLGGGGSGSTLNDIVEYPTWYKSAYGVFPQSNPYTSYEGPLDLYRYSAAYKPSFTTSSTATAYFSVDGGVTDIVGFNQYSSGDYGDFGPTRTACAGGGYGGPSGLIQDAFSCNNQTGEAFTSASPEYKMLEALGYNDPPPGAPEPSTWGMTIGGFFGLGLAGRIAGRRRHGRSPAV